MSYLPFIAGSYGATLGLAALFGIGAAIRIARAKRRLAGVEADLGRGRSGAWRR